MRLNQFLAKNLGISRRQADQLIISKKVKVNGAFGELFIRVEEADKVEVKTQTDWQTLHHQKLNQTILFYKPIFCISTRYDPLKRKTIYDFLPKIFRHLKPAGRLDYMSEGLMVLSSDGDLLQKITHPRFGSIKQYLVAIDKPFESIQIILMQEGMRLDDYDLNPVKVWQSAVQLKTFEYLKLDPRLHWYFFELTEGRNQQIRRICKLFGKRVRRLIRIRQGNYELTRELYEKKVLVEPTL